MTQILADFTAAIRQHGLTPPDNLVADGRIHRFRSGPERAENGFYSLRIVPAHKGGEIGFGTIGCWKRGLQESWRSYQASQIGDEDRTAIRRARSEQKKVELAEAAAAIGRGKEIWEKSVTPATDHPYLVVKQIKPIGIRQHKDMLVVPVYRDGGLVSLQFIGPDGTKRFLKGGSVEGGYASIAAKGADRSRIVIAEGYATGMSLHMATGLPVVICFNCNNILAVGKALRAKYLTSELIIAADNDQYC